MESRGLTIDLVPLVSQDAPKNSRILFLVEVDGPLLTNITEAEWAGMMHLSFASSSALWVTRGSLIDCKHPDHALISGMVCAMHTENRSSRFLTVDLDDDASVSRDSVFENLIQLEERAATYMPGDDFEFRCKGDVVYVSRLEDDEELNLEAKKKEDAKSTVETLPMDELKDLRAKMVFDKPGAWNTAHFELDVAAAGPLGDDEVEVRVGAASIHKVKGISWLCSGLCG